MSEVAPPPTLTAYDLQHGTVDLRPLSVIDMVDGAFSVCRSNKRLIAATVLLTMIPLQLLVAFFQRDAFVGFFTALQNPGVADDLLSGGGAPALLTSFATQIIVVPVMAGALVLIAQRGAAGVSLTGAELVRATVARSGVLIAAYIGLALVRAAPLFVVALGFAIGSNVLIALFLVISFLWAVATTPVVAVVTPALMQRDRSPADAVRHAVRLARGGYWRVVGLMLLGGFVFNVVSLLLAGLPNIFAALSGVGFAWVLVGMSTVLGQLIEAPLTAAAMVLLHQDLRIRQEGLDFDLLTRRLAYSH